MEPTDPKCSGFTCPKTAGPIIIPITNRIRAFGIFVLLNNALKK